VSVEPLVAADSARVWLGSRNLARELTSEMRKSRNILLVALAVVTAGSWLLAWSVPVSAQEGMLTPNLAPPSPNSGGPVSPGSRAQDGPITGLESILAMAGAVPSPGGAQVAGAGVREAPPGARLLLGGYTTMPVINDGNKDLTGGGDLEIEVEIAPMNSPSQGIADSVITGAAAIIWDAKAPNPNDSPGDYWQWVPAEDDEVDYVGRDSADVDTVILKMASPYRTFYTPPFFVPPLLAFPLDGAGRYITQFDLTPTADAPKTPGATVFKGTLPDVLGQLGAGEFYVGIDVWGTATVRDTPDTSWRFVFDNLTGFYTEPFVSAANVLLVDDYIRGQNWVDAARGERGGGPVEESSYRSVGFPVDEEWGVSYNAPQWLDGNKGFKRVGQAPNDIVYGSGSAAVFDTTFADYWRVACRGPLPDAIAERYLPEAIPFRHPSETDMDDPTLGPFVVGQSSNPGVIPPITPTDLYVQKKAMLWVAPYAGNLFADKGSITDPMAQAVIEGFVAQGGAILMSGGDIAWALTLNGAVNSSFLANVFGASFVADDVGNVYGKLNGLAHDDVDIAQRAGSTRGDYPLVESGNPLSLPPNNSHPWWQGWQSGNTTNPTELRLSYHPPGAVNGNFYTDGAVGLSRRMSPLFQQHWPDVIAPVGTAKVAYEYATGGAAAVYMQHPQAAPARGGRTAFLSFGLEAVSRQFTKYDPWGNGDLQVECLMLRNKVISNFLSWNRTSRIQGTVTAGAGIPGVPAGSPIAGALVVCEPITGQGHPVIGMFTDADGFFLIEGMAIDSYRVTAYAPGLAADHAAGEFTWPQGSNMEYASEEGFSMSIAPNGSISGTVTDEAGAPIEGIVVSAAGMLTTGDAITNPLTNEPIVGQATTDANGEYTITDLLSGISYAVTANPEPKVGDQANYATDNTTYSVENTSLVPVSPATETKDIDFALATVPGNVTGLVFEEGTNPKLGIAGAVVTVVGTDPALETTAGAKGAYNFGVDPFVVPAGTRTLRATAPGYEPGTITVDINANETTTDADIPLVPIPPGTITGRVTQSDGTTGVAGIQVQTWFGPVGSLVAGATTTTGADGAFTFGNIEAGVTYTLRATDPALGRNLTPDAGFRVTVEAGVTHTKDDSGAPILFKIVPLEQFASGVHLVSAPFSYPGVDPADLYGEPASSLKMAWWDPTKGAYDLYPSPLRTFERGKGYFVKFTAGRELSRSGVPNDPAVRNQPFEIPLSAAGDGWNLIGNPYDFEIDWTRVTVLHSGEALTFADAISQNLIAGSLFGYEPSARDYFIYTSMIPFRGYWVRALADGVTIRTPADPVNASSQGAVGARSSSPMAKRGVDWSMQLVAQAGEFRDSDNYLGVAPQDKGIDMRYDLDEPPMARNFADDDVTVYFAATNPDGSARMLAADFRSGLGASQTWDVYVDTTLTNTDVTLSWPDLRSLPRTFAATLEDVATGKTVAMRSASYYTYGSGSADAPRRFKVTVRNESAATNPTPQVLGVDSMARGVTVSYRLASDVDLRISVLNQAGRVVRTLVRDEHRAAGVHSETWDGRDDGGRALPAGEYRIEFRATADDGAVGRATARAQR
jgi:hypothetical protein